MANRLKLGESGYRLTVAGVGGGRINAINRMIAAGLQGVEFVAIDTDCPALRYSKADINLQIGAKLTGGRGAGGNPEIGRRAAEESRDDLTETLRKADMVFIVAGMGGGAGTGGAPVVAEAAKEAGAVLTVGVVTRPFVLEGGRRAEQAEAGIGALGKQVDNLIVIGGDQLFHLAGKQVGFCEAFRLAEDLLRQAVQGVSDLLVVPGLIDIDLDDVRRVLREGGIAQMGIGWATGEERAVEAARMAISSPLLERPVEGARGVLVNVTGGPDLGPFEAGEAAEIIAAAAGPDADIIFGAIIEKQLKEEVRVTVIATGF